MSSVERSPIHVELDAREGLVGHLAAVDEVAILVVRQGDVLCGAEALEGILPGLHLHVRVAGGDQRHDADDDERDSGDP